MNTYPNIKSSKGSRSDMMEKKHMNVPLWEWILLAVTFIFGWCGGWVLIEVVS